MKKIATLCLLVALLSACAAGRVVRRAPLYPNKETPEAKAAFALGYDAYRAGNFIAADNSFANFIATYPYTELTDKSRFFRGEIAFSEGKYESAIAFYRQSFSQVKSPNVIPKARFKAALAMYKLGRYDDVLSEIAAIDRRAASHILKLRIDSLGFMASKASERTSDQRVLWSLRILDDYAAGASYRAGDVPADELVLESTASDDVRMWVADEGASQAGLDALPFEEMKGKRSGGYVDYKRAYMMHRSGDLQGSSKLLKNYISTYPKHEFYPQARLLMAEMGGLLGEGAGIKVGAMLPLGERYSVYGSSVLHGLECALGIFEPCVGPAGIQIIVRDTSMPGMTPERAVDELAGEGVIAIVGPLLSKNAIPAAVRAEALGVPLISLSQKDGVVEVGAFAFRNYVTSDSEISTLVDYIFGNLRLKRFFVLYPENKKGEEYRDLFAGSVEKWGGKVVGSYPYAPNQMEFASELRGRGMAEQVAGLTSTGESYDAIFIPDSFKAVGYIIPTLALMGVKRAQYLGISRWDNPLLVERGGEFVEGAIFVDSFYRDSTEPSVYNFVKAFREAYGIDPTLLEAVGYDTMRMLSQSIQLSGVNSREMMKDALLRTQNFPGVVGKTSFDPSGDAKRTIQVLTIKDGAIEQVN